MSTARRLGRLVRTTVKWLVVVLVIGFAVYRVKYAPVPVIAHTIATGQVVALIPISE
jgi:hypothetical protein